MAGPLAANYDVEAALLRALTDTEIIYITQLIGQASALLRNAAPSVDSRMASFAADPNSPRGIDPQVVSAVVAGIVKRYMVNPNGLASTTDGIGPFSHGEIYALRTEKAARGVMEVTVEDLATLFPNRRRNRAGTIRTRAALAPRPVGRYGPYPTPGGAVAAAIEFDPNLPTDPQFLNRETGLLE